MRKALFSTALYLALAGASHSADVVLARDGKAMAAIYVPARVLDDPVKNPEPATVWRSSSPEDNRRRLRESVRDLAGILERITGAKFEVIAGTPKPGDTRLPILIAENARALGEAKDAKFPRGQTCRLDVTARAVGLHGDSDLAASYAVYTFLHQLGCRWYFPSPLGEVLPSARTLAVKEQALVTGPYTLCRQVWYADNDFGRRNRLGGLALTAGHALEYTVPKELRKKHPEIRAIIGGKPHEHLVKWTHPLVAQALADAALETLKKDPTTPSISLSPDDGATWDESDDAKFDAGDFDPANQTVSKTDRLMVVANRVAAKVTPKHPDLLFGILAYVDYTRPPVREKLHPSVIPQIAPITYSRAHPMNDDGEPNNKALRNIVEGWAKVAPRTSYYFYGWNLAELSGPNPMIAKWGHDIPYIYQKGNCRFWQPETITNFESCMHAQHLGIRLAWDPTEKPKDIVEELHDKLYGSAAKPMAAYWHFIDDVWAKTPEYSGCGFGHLRRWTRANLDKAQALMKRGREAAKTDIEKQRVEMAGASLALFDEFMDLRQRLSDGRFADLDARAKAYVGHLVKLGTDYEKQYAFGGGLSWAKDKNVNSSYFSAFYEETYKDAARIARDFIYVTPALRGPCHFAIDKKKKGEKAGWAAPGFDDSKWRKVDCMVDTWSALGLHNYMGSAWYRMRAPMPATPKGKKVFLWVGATDGRVKVFVNGKHVPHLGPKGEKADSFSGFCQPTSFDVTAALTGGSEVQISLLCTREVLNELGTGGLLSPVVLYREK